MVTRAAVAIIGLKLRAVLRKTRLPQPSPFQALTRAKSPVSGAQDVLARRRRCASPCPRRPWCRRRWACRSRRCRRRPRGSARPACPAGRARPRARRRGTAARTPCSRRRSEATIFRICWALSRMPSPRSVVPQLLEMIVRSFTPLPVQRGDQVLRVAAQAEAARHDRRAVRDVRDGRVGRLDHLVHVVPCSRSTISARPRRRRCRARPRRASSQVLHGVEQGDQDAGARGADGVPSATAPPRTLTVAGRARAAGCWRSRPPRRPR